WHPRYTVHGFRYVEVTGWPGEPTSDDVTGCAINNDIAAAGRFECSHELFNQIHHNVWHTFRGSFQGIPQDAAERAERVAWLGDPGYVAEDYMLNFADARFWRKWLDDIADSQKPDGACPFIAPPSWESSYRDWPCWENSYSLFAWFVYLYNDDPHVLERHYDGLRKQVERFRSLAKDHILPEPLGDHMEPRGDSTSSFSPTRTPPELAATAYHSRCAWILSEAARLLGREEDAKVYSDLAREIRAAFNERFFDAEAGHYGADSQTANALALYLGLVPEGREKDVLDHLVKLIDDRGGHLSTGIIGTDALEQALGAHGRADVMYAIAAQRTFPGWGYGVTVGQTTIAEDFECSPGRSLSMKMLGSVEKFFYRDVAGLALAGPGYRAIEVRPKVTDRLEWATASIDTVRGPAAVEWKKTDDGLIMKVAIPVGATATVSIPTPGREAAMVTVTEGGGAVWRDGAFVAGVAGVTGGRQDEGFVTLEVGSGSYEFAASGGRADVHPEV
ncbi:MAG: family 78 glycoside hydrolase catalytic domain, partial [Planctomycetota bacterium]